MNNNKKTWKTIVFSFLLAALLLPTTGWAQAYDKEAAESYNGGAFYELIAYDTYLDELANVLKAVELNRGGASITGGSITNDDFGTSPLGSGLGILLAAGAGYAVVRRKRSRKNTTLLLACVLLLGFTQCKKEQIEPQGGKVSITLNVENGGASTGSATDGAKVNVDPYNSPMVTFENGDKILVASNGHYVGTLTHNGINFSGDITDPVVGEPLYFYFLGNKATGTLTPGASGSTSCTVNISDQTNELPVISFSESNRDYDGPGEYSASLHNQCALVKFNTTDINKAITITGMKNEVTVDFSTNGYTYNKTGTGEIRLHAVSNTERWAILLPQDEVTTATAFASGYTTTSVFTVPAVAVNNYNNTGVDVELTAGSTKGAFTINASGDQVFFSQGNLQYLGTGDSYSLTPVWRFAVNQYDYMGNGPGSGSNNGNVSISGYSTYNNAITTNQAPGEETNEYKKAARDLFGWGTSGGGTPLSNPYTTTTGSLWSSYYGGTSSIAGTNNDWGVYLSANGLISNGEGHSWRTLTKDEWYHLFNTRTVNGGVGSGKSYSAKVTVNGVTGIVLYPDNYTGSVYNGSSWLCVLACCW